MAGVADGVRNRCAETAGDVAERGVGSARLGDARWLQQRRAAGWSVKRLAAELDVDHHKVSAALRGAGLPIPLPRTLHHPQLHDLVWLRHALATTAIEGVARQLGCAPQSVRYAARKYAMGRTTARPWPSPRPRSRSAETAPTTRRPPSSRRPPPGPITGSPSTAATCRTPTPSPTTPTALTA